MYKRTQVEQILTTRKKHSKVHDKAAKAIKPDAAIAWTEGKFIIRENRGEKNMKSLRTREKIIKSDDER